MKPISINIIILLYLISFLVDSFFLYKSYQNFFHIEKSSSYVQDVNVNKYRGLKTLQIKITDHKPNTKNIVNKTPWEILEYNESKKYDLENNFAPNIRWYLQEIPKIGDKIIYYKLNESLINPNQFLGLSKENNPASKFKVFIDIFSGFEWSFWGVMIFILQFVITLIFFKYQDNYTITNYISGVITTYIVVKFMILGLFS